MNYGIRYDEYGAASGTVRFTKVKFFRIGPKWPEPVRYFEDSTAIRWWVRRDLEGVLVSDGSYILAPLCHLGNRLLPRVHCATGDVNALRSGTRALFRSEDMTLILERFGTKPAIIISEAIRQSTTKREKNPLPPTTCDHCGQSLAHQLTLEHRLNLVDAG